MSNDSLRMVPSKKKKFLQIEKIQFSLYVGFLLSFSETVTLPKKFAFKLVRALAKWILNGPICILCKASYISVFIQDAFPAYASGFVGVLVIFAPC